MLSDNIRSCRKEKNMSQDELAEKLGVSRQSISLWETGQTQPTIDNIISLAKIFNITSDELLRNTDGTSDNISDSEDNTLKKGKKLIFKNKKMTIIIIVVVALVIIGGITSFVLIRKEHIKNVNSRIIAESTSEFQSEIMPDLLPSETISETVTNNSAVKSGQTKSASATEKPQPSATEKPQEAKSFDLFSYCKDFAIKKGTLNGDHCIYQQPASRYGGYAGEYFSISYWGDSNMVEFCLHCPLDDTYSINFYLRMRGGYNKKYEYLTSCYYRTNGESIRSASGYIDPAVFSDSYPLNCNKYIGSANGQDSFMEESRVGMCDLIHCLKQFVSVENMECSFSDFDFVNF